MGVSYEYRKAPKLCARLPVCVRQRLGISKRFYVTDRELIEGCIREERACQEELFRRYAGKLLSICRRYARHEMEAEDLLQDALIRIFDHLDKFEYKGSLEGWMRRITVNTALKNCNRSGFRKESIGIDAGQDQVVDPEAVSHLSEEELLHLIRELPEGYRLVFNLYAIEGYSHKEIAEMLDIKEGTSRSQLVKARKMLQDKIQALKTNYYEHKSF